MRLNVTMDWWSSLGFLLILMHTVCSDLLESSNMLFQLNWQGSLPVNPPGTNSIIMTTTDNERYECILPQDRNSNANDVINYPGPSPQALIEGIFKKKICTVRIETYWSYELCHGRHIRQFHEEKMTGTEIKLQEFSLGTTVEYPSGDSYRLQEMDTITAADGGDISDLKAPTTLLAGKEVPFFELIMTDGSVCDLTKGQPRKTHVLYICDETGRNEIYSLKETSSCEYEAIILTPVICAHPLYRMKDTPISNINCYALDGASPRPVSYTKLFASPQKTQYTSSKTKDKSPKTASPAPPTTAKGHASSTVPPPHKPLPSLDSDQLIKQFLAGDYCLHGGQGWWKYEFCYGQFAHQYHEDKNGRIEIVLGTWSRADHIAWWSKTSKSVGSSRSVTHFYSNGDTCDLTGRPREVQVRLKCSENMQPHAVSIYLIEPNTCEYILGVESPIVCNLLDTADEYGLLHLKETKP